MSLHKRSPGLRGERFSVFGNRSRISYILSVTNSSFNILLTDSADMYGGGQFFVFELAKALLLRNHSVVVSCKPNNSLRERCDRSNIPVAPLDFPPKGQLLRFISELQRIIRSNKIQIIHTNNNYDRTAGAFAAWRAGIAHVTNVHSFQSIQYNLTHRLRNKMMIDRFLADGASLRSLLVNHDGIPASKVSVFYHGVNPEEMRRDEHLRQAVRVQLGFTEQEVVIGHVGRFVQMKGQEYLLNAFSDAVRTFPNARLVLVGDGELREELVLLSQALGIDRRVTFTGFREDLQALYSSFDLYVQSSIEGGGETISFAVQQALAQELPVIVTRTGDVAENVREGINGFVVPDRNASAIAEKLRVLLANSSLREEMGKQGRNYLLERFTTTHMVTAVEEAYREVLNDRKSSS